jgi:hypothetical protein
LEQRKVFLKNFGNNFHAPHKQKILNGKISRCAWGAIPTESPELGAPTIMAEGGSIEDI